MSQSFELLPYRHSFIKPKALHSVRTCFRADFTTATDLVITPDVRRVINNELFRNAVYIRQRTRMGVCASRKAEARENFVPGKLSSKSVYKIFIRLSRWSAHRRCMTTLSQRGMERTRSASHQNQIQRSTCTEVERLVDSNCNVDFCLFLHWRTDICDKSFDRTAAESSALADCFDDVRSIDR